MMIPNFGWVVPGELAGSGDIGGWRTSDVGLLRQNMSWLVDEGIGGIATLTESSLDESIVEENGFEYKHIPVVDMAPPSVEAVLEFLSFSKECLKNGKAVLVHCSAGLGRTGTMLSCYLVGNGTEPFEAIQRIRQLRPGSVETLEQEMRVLEYANSIGLDSDS